MTPEEIRKATNSELFNRAFALVDHLQDPDLKLKYKAAVNKEWERWQRNGCPESPELKSLLERMM